MKQKILNKLNLGEDHERECKLATGGLPESIWETYSSFANTNGGTILLGIREHRDSFTVEGLTDKQIIKYQKDFWSVLNDKNKVFNLFDIYGNTALDGSDEEFRKKLDTQYEKYKGMFKIYTYTFETDSNIENSFLVSLTR